MIRSTMTEIGIEADDDQPIGSMLKLKRSRNTKRVKGQLGGSWETDQTLEVREGNSQALTEELGGMDDTLATFRKKLKSNKKAKGVGSRTPKVKDSALSVPVDDCDALPRSNNVDQDLDVVDFRSNVTIDGGKKNMIKGDIKRTKIDSRAEDLDESVSFGLKALAVAGLKEGVLLPEELQSPYSDGKCVDSLSVDFCQAQSGITKNVQSSFSLKQTSVDLTIDDTFPRDSMVGALRRHQIVAEIRNESLDKHARVVEDVGAPDSNDSGSQKDPTVNPCNQVDSLLAANEIGQSEFEDMEDGNRLYPVDDVIPNVSDSVPRPDVQYGLKMEENHRISEGEISKACFDYSNQQREAVFPVPILSAEHEKIFTPVKGEKLLPSYGDELLTKPYITVFEETHDLELESSQKCFEVDYDEKNMVKPECMFVRDQCLDLHHQAQSRLSYAESDLPKLEKTDNKLDNFNTQTEEPPLTQDSFKKENHVVSDCRCQVNDQDKAIDHMDLCHRCNFVSHQSQPPEDSTEGTGILAHSNVPPSEAATRASSMSATLDENESSPGDVVSIPDSDVKDSYAVQRAMRNAKKRRHGDMAYEGDADWDNLIDDQGFLEGQSDRSYKTREKSDTSSTMLKDAEVGETAAIAAGLKARSLIPIEKIIFKEVLKRKVGIQEYLECRNYILGLWSKDVSRKLSMMECKVECSGNPSEEKSPRKSLLREVYAFLDQRGYINVGIASKTEKEEPPAKDNCNVSDEKKLEEVSVADSDGVAFVSGQVDTTGSGKNGVVHEDGSWEVELAESKVVVPSVRLELANINRDESCPLDDNMQSGNVNANVPSRLDNLEAPGSGKLITDGVAVMALEKHLAGAQFASYDHEGVNSHLQFDSKVRKKIIVIGAGPAGLTAARHLQRHGFSVTVLEGRNRTGGRVYTDRSSLSVPVDLGASIITGIEADVASERRPDPSSLVCTQLGLELSVLHGFCPLYDIATGQKVPSDLDDSLQAEFNSLIDEIDFLVEQIGKERANRISLEDGLEYGLRSLRMPHSRLDIEKLERSNLADASSGSRTNSIDGKLSCSGSLKDDVLSPLERRVMNWHFAHTEYGCAAVLKEVSLPNWNQDEYYGGFGGAHAMIKGGYSTVADSLAEGLNIQLNHVVTEVMYSDSSTHGNHPRVKVCASNGSEFLGDAVLITLPLGCLKAETIKFSPPLPEWKRSSIQRLGFGVLNKVVLEFPEVFWDDSVDYFGATAEETGKRGQCFMFWNVRKTVGAPVLIALVVGKAAVQTMLSSEHVNHAMMVLRTLFGKTSVPDPVASVVTDWGRDPFSYGAYSYVAIGASGEDYDILGRPVQNCLFFAGEATCKEHPDTVGGAMISGLREAVRIIDIFGTGNDYTAEADAMEAAQRTSVSVRDEVTDIINRLEMVELSNILTRQALLRNMFFTAKTTVGRLHLAKELLNLPAEALKSFAGTREGLTTLNSWILDSMGKNGTQLLRHCANILVRVSTDLLAVRLSGIGKTVKEKVYAHTSRDIRAIASQLVSVWLEIFRKEKASLRPLRQTDPSKKRVFRDSTPGKPPRCLESAFLENKSRFQDHGSDGSHLPIDANIKKQIDRPVKAFALSEEEQAAFAAAEAARAAAEAAAKAYASTGAKCNTSLQLPKIPSFQKFVRRDSYVPVDEPNFRKKWSAGALRRQDSTSETDSKNCKSREHPIGFPVDRLSPRSHSMEMANPLQFRECSGESADVDSSIFSRVWVHSAGSEGIRDSHAINRWMSQAAAADPQYVPRWALKDEVDSNASSRPPAWKTDRRTNDSTISQVTVSKEPPKSHPRGADRIKQAVVDYVASLLMPLYKARKIDKDSYKSIMKRTATKVMEQATDTEKGMPVAEFLDFKRKNKIRAFVDKLIEKHMSMMQVSKS